MLYNKEDPYKVAEDKFATPNTAHKKYLDTYESFKSFKERSLLTQVHKLRKATATP
jgi:hypothetical protein